MLILKLVLQFRTLELHTPAFTNLPGPVSFNQSLPWVSKIIKDGTITVDTHIFVDKVWSLPDRQLASFTKKILRAQPV
jgi:hypothetical protein